MFDAARDTSPPPPTPWPVTDGLINSRAGRTLAAVNKHWISISRRGLCATEGTTAQHLMALGSTALYRTLHQQPSGWSWSIGPVPRISLNPQG